MSTTPAPTATDSKSGNRRIDSFGMVLTEKWHVLPIDREEFDQHRTDVLNRLDGLEGWSKTDSRKLDLVLQKVRRDLLTTKARFAAHFMDVGVPDGADPIADNVEPLIAGLTFSVYTQDDFKTELDLTPEVLFAAFAIQNNGAAKPNQRVTDLETPRITQLPVGRVVHLRRLVEPASTLDTTSPFFIETFILPLGADRDTCGIVQFITPTISESSSFSKMFNQLANTITVLADGDETIFNGTGATQH